MRNFPARSIIKFQFNLQKHRYSTHPETILQYEEDKMSRLSRIVWDESYEESTFDEETGEFFINRDGKSFNIVLNYLRCNKNPDHIMNLELTEGEWYFFVQDIQFYGIKSLIEVTFKALLGRIDRLKSELETARRLSIRDSLTIREEMEE